MTRRINRYRCSHCGCDDPIHNDIDGKLYCNNCGMRLENSSVTNRNKTDSAVKRVSDEWLNEAIPKYSAIDSKSKGANVYLALCELRERRQTEDKQGKIIRCSGVDDITILIG